MSAAGPRSRLWRPAPVAGLVAALAIAAIVGPNVLAAALARGRSYAQLSDVPARSVAIVPGSPVPRGKPSSLLRARLEAALTLYGTGRVKAILVSGNDTTASPEVSVMDAFLRARGVPARDVWTDSEGSRTRETMRRAAGLYGVTDAIVCTESVHLARSLYLARTAGIDAVGISIPTALAQSRTWKFREALKTTLAVVESTVRSGPEAFAGDRTSRLVATR